MPGVSPTDVADLAGGYGHTCGLTLAGGVKCWGRNDHGQLGDGTNTDRLEPVDVSGLASGVLSVVAGVNHTCVLTKSGGVKCWGSNANGQIGDGTNRDRWLPVDVSGLAAWPGDPGVQALAAGDRHTCAVTVAGQVKCWGWNESGQVGDRQNRDRWLPADVLYADGSPLMGVKALAGGGRHTCALLDGDGSIKCWGDNGFGQLGNDAQGGSYAASAVLNADGSFFGGNRAISTGANHTCALTNGGAAKCWGLNDHGQLGDGTDDNRWRPTIVSGLPAGVHALAASQAHTCAVVKDVGVKCWGANLNGQLGDGTDTAHAAPVSVTGLFSDVVGVETGADHSCARLIDNRVKCWGRNQHGQLGDSTAINRLAPVWISRVESIQSRLGYCFQTTFQGVHCWQPGRGWVFADTDAVAVADNGDTTSCLVTATGGARCWGHNIWGQLGNGTNADASAPTDVFGLTSGVKAIALGDRHTCALTTAGGVKCWGENGSGQLGNWSDIDSWVPVDVWGLSSGVRAIAASGVHTCALGNWGNVVCWGGNRSSESGAAGHGDMWLPVGVWGLSDVKELGAGARHNCVLTGAGGVRCWGQNNAGQLGDGSTTEKYVPVDVNGLTRGVKFIAVGDNHSCALMDNGTVKCWGDGYYGQLGNGSQHDQSRPMSRCAAGLRDILDKVTG